MPHPLVRLHADLHTLADLQDRDGRRSGRRSELLEWKAYRTPRERILEACIAIADADSEDDAAYHRAWVRFRKALVDLGWRPPKPLSESAIRVSSPDSDEDPIAEGAADNEASPEANPRQPPVMTERSPAHGCKEPWGKPQDHDLGE